MFYEELMRILVRDPREAQESPGEPRRAQESPAEPSRDEETTGEPRKTQESPGDHRRAQEQESPERSRRAQSPVVCDSCGSNKSARTPHHDQGDAAKTQIQKCVRILKI